MKLKKKKILKPIEIGVAIAFMTIIGVTSVEAHRVRRVNVCISPSGCVEIDSVDYRKDLTRVYGRLKGQPHSSMRIDAVTGATDIDGIDIKRWFQFEEGGEIPIEIDFGIIPNKLWKFQIHSTKGTIECLIKQ